MSDQSINSGKAPEPVGLYPHAKRVGNLLFLSGVGPRERGTKKIPGVTLNEAGAIESYDIEAQCRSVFQNVRWILGLTPLTQSWSAAVVVERSSFFPDQPLHLCLPGSPLRLGGQP